MELGSRWGDEGRIGNTMGGREILQELRIPCQGWRRLQS